MTYEDVQGVTRHELVPANHQGQAVERFLDDHPELDRECLSAIEAVEKWPEVAAEKGRHTHAWFAGFLQRLGPDSRPRWQHPPRIALAVLLEFGGSGGRTAGPVCRDVARLILNEFPQLVDPQARIAGGTL